MKNKGKLSLILVVTLIVGYKLWISFFTPAGELPRKLEALQEEIIDYAKQYGEWPKDLDFVADKELLELNGIPVEFEPNEVAVNYPITYWPPHEKILHLIGVGPTTGRGFALGGVKIEDLNQAR
ncbi:MAG: hypothetical protein NWT02_04155 [Opitutales bacterium]|jgi:hypothetical protein|nr:hypothetical protein [Opitutales bacterium]MDP4882495.1 hypothetical protein [Opitutales bacterium]MDP5079648.1 hypothetical protein [Opitutales bacterium]